MNPEQNLIAVLEKYTSLAIAFSGGVDSTLLAFEASRHIKGRVLLVHICSAFSIRRETEFVKRWSSDNNIPLEIIEMDPLAVDDIRLNPKDRCYHCKKVLMASVIRKASESGIRTVADGTNLDDLGDYRPGIIAAGELGILHPMLESGLGKKDIVELARLHNLPNWNVPASACLASRIPYGTEITVKALKMIGKAEDILYARGFRLNRVRMIGDTARIEVSPDKIPSLQKIMNEIEIEFKEIGFGKTEICPVGYKQGALNQNH